jgi:hypothetical protein
MTPYEAATSPQRVRVRVKPPPRLHWFVASGSGTFCNKCNIVLHYKKLVFFVMSPKIVDILLDINILGKEM